MRVLSLAALVAGLAAGVVGMVLGIDRLGRGGTRVKYLNLPTFAATATVFGIVAYPLAAYTAFGTVAISVIAGSAGLAAGSAMLALIAGWAVPSARREVIDERYVLQGHFALVVSAIPAGAPGEIEFKQEGSVRRSPAQSVDGSAIESGAEVVLERIEGGVAHVERWSTIARQLELPE